MVNLSSWSEAQTKITDGGVAVIPTDTIYGLVASVSNTQAIEKINQLKNRALNKPYVILISNTEQLNNVFHINLTSLQKNILNQLWPGPFSIGFNSQQAFRLPESKLLIDFLNTVGPLVATSCNTSTEPHATTIQEAWGYFGDQVDCYVKSDLEPLLDQPSTIITLDQSGKIDMIRQGMGLIPNNLLFN